MKETTKIAINSTGANKNQNFLKNGNKTVLRSSKKRKLSEELAGNHQLDSWLKLKNKEDTILPGTSKIDNASSRSPRQTKLPEHLIDYKLDAWLEKQHKEGKIMTETSSLIVPQVNKNVKKEDKVKETPNDKNLPNTVSTNYKTRKRQHKENKTSITVTKLKQSKVNTASKLNESKKLQDKENRMDMSPVKAISTENWLDQMRKAGNVIENVSVATSSDIGKNSKSNNYKNKKLKDKPKENEKRSSSKNKKTQSKPESAVKQSSLDNFIQKKNVKKKKNFARSESSDSIDLPSFASKNMKKTKKSSKALPTVQEILQEQKDLEEYRAVLNNFKPLDDSALELSFTTKDLYKAVEKIDNLDCKQVPIKKLEQIFKNNLKRLSGIINGTISNTRHNKFYDLNRRQVTLTCEDLTYNTSMIVFTYDQKDYLLKLLSKEFDPEDKKTQYFFQVLLPELCLLIFMETHQMDREKALEYLDKRPILPDD